MAAKSSSGAASKKPAAKSGAGKTATQTGPKTSTRSSAKTVSTSKPAAAPVASPTSEPGGLQAGDVAPAFKLPGAGGGHLSLAGLKGKKVVLYFYPKDDTSGCTKEAIEFNALKDDFAEAGAVVVGVSPDGVKSHDKFREKYGLTFPLAADEDKETLNAYGVWIEKSMYGKKYMGVDRSTFLIDAKGRVARVWRKVKVPGHAEEVLAAARGL
jgi:peroxiredoxin Q/BCP